MKRIINLMIVIVFSFFMVVDANAQTAGQLLMKMDSIIFGPNDKQGNVKIVLINRSGNEKVREATMLQKGSDKKIYRYTHPESQAGIATLSLPGGTMWLYMPAFGKPKKISLLAKSQAFTGTDFSYEDMVPTPYADRYSAQLIDEKDNAYVLVLTPNDEESSYSKIVLTLNKKHYYPERMEYYDRGNRKYKEASYDYEKTGKYWNARQVIMADLQKQHMTKIILSDMRFDQGISDDIFTVENLVPEDETE